MRAILRVKYACDSVLGTRHDTGIVVAEDSIVDVGPFKEVASRSGNLPVREYDGIVCPALINAHTHLELSGLRKDNFHHSDFVDWVIKLVDTRTSMLSVDFLPECLRAKRDAEEKGTGYFVNVGNDFSLNESLGNNQLFAFEQIGINSSSAEKIFNRSKEILTRNGRVPASLAIHAPYSVSPSLMKSVKSFNNGLGAVTSIHLAETQAETEFVGKGTGRMTDLLNHRVPDWSFEPAGVSPVKYVDKLGLLDDKTLCVHSVFVNDEDVEILKERRCAVALCVRSNLELTGQLPPVDKFLRSGVRILIGTDSTASSPDINMFAEMAAFYSRFHKIMDPERVFAAATTSAAHFLGIDKFYGSLEKGKKAALVFVAYDGGVDKVFERLVTAPDSTKIPVEL